MVGKKKRKKRCNGQFRYDEAIVWFHASSLDEETSQRFSNAIKLHGHAKRGLQK